MLFLIAWISIHDKLKQARSNTREAISEQIGTPNIYFVLHVLTHWGRDKMANIFQMTF